MGTDKLKIIKDYEKMSDELLEQLKLEYPNGFSNYIFEFINPKDGRLVRAVELETEDKLYLIRLPQDSDFLFIDDEETEMDLESDDIIDDNFDNSVEISDIDINEEEEEEEEEDTDECDDDNDKIDDEDSDSYKKYNRKKHKDIDIIRKEEEKDDIDEY